MHKAIAQAAQPEKSARKFVTHQAVGLVDVIPIKPGKHHELGKSMQFQSPV